MVKKKKKRLAGGSITDEVRRQTGIGGETTSQKRKRFLKSQGRDPEATGKEAEDQLRRSKGLKPKEPEAEEEKPGKIEIRRPEEAPPEVSLEEKKAGPEGLISERPLTEQEEAAVEPSLAEQPAFNQILAGAALTGGLGASAAGVKGLGGVLGGPAKLLVSATGRTVLAGLAGTSGIMTWLANDNIISGMTIFTRDLRNAVTFGQMSPQEAIGKMDEAQATVDKARAFINTNTAINPLLWPFRGIIMANADAAQDVLDNNREVILGAGAVQAVEEEEPGEPQNIPSPETTESL